MSCPAFIVQSLAVRTAAHLLHLSAKSCAQHNALGSFYEDLLELVDEYAEVYMGLEGLVTVWPDAEELDTASAVRLLEEYLALVQDEARGKDADSQALLGVLADLETLVARTLYKLRHLK